MRESEWDRDMTEGDNAFYIIEIGRVATKECGSEMDAKVATLILDL